MAIRTNFTLPVYWIGKHISCLLSPDKARQTKPNIVIFMEKLEHSIIPQLAFSAIKDAKNNYEQNKTFTNEDLEALHSFFGETLVLATELLENCSIDCYKTTDNSRKVFKILTKNDQYTIYDNINFCTCQAFQCKVLTSRSMLTCQHILAVILGNITGKVKEEIVTGLQLKEFYNEQLNNINNDV